MVSRRPVMNNDEITHIVQDHNLLISELHSLIVESKRRNPEVKEVKLNRTIQC